MREKEREREKDELSKGEEKNDQGEPELKAEKENRDDDRLQIFMGLF